MRGLPQGSKPPGTGGRPFARATGRACLRRKAQDVGSGIQKRDPRGHWSVVSPYGKDVGQVFEPTSLAVDAAGNLYVVDEPDMLNGISRIQKRDTHGNWSVISRQGALALAVDAACVANVPRPPAFRPVGADGAGASPSWAPR